METFPMILILVAVAVVFCFVAAIPGMVARQRKHPQADAIALCGWLGLFFSGGLGWIVAIVWAYTKVTPRDS